MKIIRWVFLPITLLVALLLAFRMALVLLTIFLHPEEYDYWNEEIPWEH